MVSYVLLLCLFAAGLPLLLILLLLRPAIGISVLTAVLVVWSVTTLLIRRQKKQQEYMHKKNGL
ncbi:hypothetical protein [Shouchella shacheensis]|uniref:hypothetical protein n=1 Tax=Shouchella shacheensis TaxID=1649580 RepID=UPI000A9CFB8D|nr:hypothetical protein [Shouchella shacheensis]